jgi:hypothetical protein
LPKLNGLHAVYEGGFHPELPYRRYLPLINRLSELGCTVHVFPTGRPTDFPGPFIRREKLPYGKLLEEMTRFHFGITGYNYDALEPVTVKWLDSNLPNKGFDYNAAGLPVLVWNAKNIYDEMKSYGSTLFVDDLSKLERSDLESLAQGSVRRAPSMEDAILGLKSFYESV